MPDEVPLIDQVAWPIAEELLACLCSELESTLGGPPCRCCIYPGADVPMDACGTDGGRNGQAAVRIGSMTPTTSWPNLVVTGGPCDSITWAVEYELVVYRCVSTVDDNANAPSCDALRYDAAMLADDAAAMRRAVMCCLGDPEDPCSMGLVQPGAYNPVPIQGGCGGGSMTVTIARADCCPDPESV